MLDLRLHQTSSTCLNQQERVERKARQFREGAGQSRKHVTELAGGRRGQRGAERDERLRGSGGRLKPGEKQDYWGGPSTTVMMKLVLQTSSSTLSTVIGHPHSCHRKRRKRRRVTRGAEKARRQRGGRRGEGLNVGICILMVI